MFHFLVDHYDLHFINVFLAIKKMHTQVPLLIYMDKSESMCNAPCNINVTATQMCKRIIFPHSLPALKYI